LGSAQLLQPQGELGRFAQALADKPQIASVTITGHTDHLGTAAGNQRLSQQRAESVKVYLVSKGVASSRLVAKGVGSAQPVVQCTQKAKTTLIACLEPNRRVEIEPITVEKR
jgi:OmpA-OmpF porin, OOP family